jgi:hypothetical protein
VNVALPRRSDYSSFTVIGSRCWVMDGRQARSSTLIVKTL